MNYHIQTLAPPAFLPPNFFDALRQLRLIYTPILIQYTPARLIALTHLRLFCECFSLVGHLTLSAEYNPTPVY
jgi:hypothetical protein